MCVADKKQCNLCLERNSMRENLLEKETKKTSGFDVYFSHLGFSVPLRGLKMRRLNIFSFYELGACFGALRLVGSHDSQLIGEILTAAQWQLRKVVRGEDFPVIEILGLPASAIHVDIDEALKQTAVSGRVGGDEEKNLTKRIAEFEAILRAKLPTEQTYTVEQVRGFSIPILVDEADRNLATSTLLSVGDEVRKDIKERSEERRVGKE